MNPLRARWTLDPEVRFLNHGSFGACPAVVLERQAELRARIEREPVLFLARELEARVDEARASLAPFLGVSQEDVVPVTNATTGVNAVLRSLDFGVEDEILVTSHGYNACNNVAEFVAARAGARLVVVDVPFPSRGGEEVLERVLAAVTKRTRIALIDHVTSPTGLVFPVAEVVRELRERGVETLVDGAHAPGMVELDVGAIGAAYYTGNLHKWLCAPKGAGFLYVRRDLQARIRPTVLSHGANSPRRDRSRFRLEFDYTGTDDPSAFLCLPDCLRFFETLVPGGLGEVRRRNHELVVAGRERICAALGVAPPAPESMLGSLGSVPLPLAAGSGPAPIGVDPLQRVLFEKHGIEVPVFTWPAHARLIRVSAQVYNEIEEYEALARALVEELSVSRSAIRRGAGARGG